MRQSQKKILIHNVMAFVLIVCGVVMISLSTMAIDKIAAWVVVFIALGLFE